MVDAVVISKRMDINHYRHNDDYYSSSSTSYYVCFQVESGDRIELNVRGQDYGTLVEGDRGKLTFQGTRYLGFQRIY